MVYIFFYFSIAQHTFQRSPRYVPLIHSHITCTSSICCHLRPQVLANSPHSLTVRHLVSHAFDTHFHTSRAHHNCTLTYILSQLYTFSYYIKLLFFSLPLTTFHILYFSLAIFRFSLLFHYCRFHAKVLGTTLVHEFHICTL